MILGIGTDLTNVERIQKLLNRYGDKFRNRVFTEIEQLKASSQKYEASYYAKRWAAKEACSKALGTGIKMGIFWRDMTVSNLKSGKPTMTVTGEAKKRLQKITPYGHKSVIHLSITDDYPWAQAFVNIEARPIAVLPNTT